MAKKKKHSRVEIATKLAQAKQVKLQSEIAHRLGMSVMTLHRWRKAPPGPQAVEAAQPNGTRRLCDRIAHLQLENSCLRRLLTDLLLEKIKLEETAQTSIPTNGRMHPSKISVRPDFAPLGRTLRR